MAPAVLGIPTPRPTPTPMLEISSGSSSAAFSASCLLCIPRVAWLISRSEFTVASAVGVDAGRDADSAGLAAAKTHRKSHKAALTPCCIAPMVAARC